MPLLMPFSLPMMLLYFARFFIIFAMSQRHTMPIFCRFSPLRHYCHLIIFIDIDFSFFAIAAAYTPYYAFHAALLHYAMPC